MPPQFRPQKLWHWMIQLARETQTQSQSEKDKRYLTDFIVQEPKREKLNRKQTEPHKPMSSNTPNRYTSRPNTQHMHKQHSPQGTSCTADKKVEHLIKRDLFSVCKTVMIVSTEVCSLDWNIRPSPDTLAPGRWWCVPGTWTTQAAD